MYDDHTMCPAGCVQLNNCLTVHVQLCHAVALRGLLPCLGGVRVLLPLVSLLDLPAPGWAPASCWPHCVQ